MPAVQRKGDSNSAGGSIQSGVDSVRVNGISISVEGNSVSAHPFKHFGKTTSGGSGTVKAAGRRVIRTGDSDSCGHSRQGGSPNVKAG